jgi:hypothetical protein
MANQLLTQDVVTVHDPRGYPPKVVGKRLAPRLENLDGKKLHLVDCLFDNSEVFMMELQGWFARNLPGVITTIVKPRESWADDPQLRARVAAEADAAVFGVGL